MSVSDKPWGSFTQADYTPQQWARACLIDTGEGDPDSKARYKLPVREPGGALNRNGVHAAAGGHGVGAVTGVSAEAKRAAARKLVGYYRNDLKEDPPESLLSMAGMAQASSSRSEQVENDDGRRSVPFELRSESTDGLTLEGYAAVFDSPTMIPARGRDFEETIRRGAFADSLRARMPILMFEHGQHPLIGSMPLGVIQRAEEDSTGVEIRARLSDNWLIQPVRDAIRDRAVTGMSVRMVVSDEQWVDRQGKPPQRSILRANVLELGPVIMPAYELTTATIRSLVERLPDFTVRPDTRSAGGGESGARPGSGGVPHDNQRIRAWQDVLMRTLRRAPDA